MAEDLDYKQFADYLIYRDGTVKSLLTGKNITKRVGPRGYYQINLCIDGKCKTFVYHRLLAIAFIPNPDNLPCVNHIDGNKLNCQLSNLEWVTYSGNIRHAFDNGLIHTAVGKRTKCGRFTEDDIKQIRMLRDQGKSQYEIASIYNVTRGAIQSILNGKTYRWVV